MTKLKSLFHFVAPILGGRSESSQMEVLTPIGSNDLGNLRTAYRDPIFRPKTISSKNTFPGKVGSRALFARTTKNV
ncbi:hypothetical protein [Arenibacter certesii]|uniref:hypothetical protein n=1 Tax=Arenibacter certesii TaxID=228955 RepID=UPI0004298A2A|nr:hypothetical protein [Arenibacter certesii]